VRRKLLAAYLALWAALIALTPAPLRADPFASGSTLAALAYSYTLAAITVTATTLSGDIVDIACDGV